MNNQAAQTMPLPEPRMRELNPYHGSGIDPYDGATHLQWYSAEQMHQYARDYAAALSQTAGVADDMAAAEQLCRIYFEIAADALGEDVVRAERDRRISALAVAPAASGWNITDHSHEIGFDDGLDGPAASGGEGAFDVLDKIANHPVIRQCETAAAGFLFDSGYKWDGGKWVAPQPPAGASVSERARELLAAEYDNEGVHGLAESIRAGTFTTHLDQCSINAITNALASAPDGFALVPVEPTAAMKDAGDYSKWNYDDAADIYKAMLRASGYAARGTKELVIALEQALTQQRGGGPSDAGGDVAEYQIRSLDPYSGDLFFGWKKITKNEHDRAERQAAMSSNELTRIELRKLYTTPQPGAEALRDVPGNDPRVDDDSFTAAVRACRSQLGALRPNDDEPEEQWMWDKLTKLESLLARGG